MKSLPAGFAALVGSDVTVFGAPLWLLKFRAEWNGKERLFFFYFPHFSLMERSLFVSQFVSHLTCFEFFLFLDFW